MKKLNLLVGALVVCMTGVSTITWAKSEHRENAHERKTISFENVTELKDFVQTGTFQGKGTPPLLQPGQQTEVKFYAAKGQTLSFVTMYGNSKDLFFAPVNPGIALFDASGNAITGDVSSQVKLWDNGTNINSDPSRPATQQNTGMEDKNVTEITGTDGSYNYPMASEMMKLTLAYDADKSQFTLTILNNTDKTNVKTPFSPGVWAVSNVLGGKHLSETPFYQSGKKTTPELTAIATTGNNQPFSNRLKANTGVITGLSPIMVVVYTGERNPVFQVNQKDGGIGLKNLAQTGDASVLKKSLEKESAVKKVYVLGNSGIAPGAKEEKTIKIKPSEKVAFATMFGYSNDWFYANNTPITINSSGDITKQVSLYDNGTVVSQYPGAGNAQADFGNSHPVVENQSIRMINQDTYPDFNIPAVNKIIKVTIK